MADFTPAGTADGNSDAVRQSGAAAWFNSFENILHGIDDARRLSPQTDNQAQVLGFGTSYGLDVGVGNNGEIYARGRTGQIGSDATSGAPAPAPARFRITPTMLLLLVGAFLILRK